jgi:hypothetical protein
VVAEAVEASAAEAAASEADADNAEGECFCKKQNVKTEKTFVQGCNLARMFF